MERIVPAAVEGADEDRPRCRVLPMAAALGRRKQRRGHTRGGTTVKITGVGEKSGSGKKRTHRGTPGTPDLMLTDAVNGH